MSESKRKNSSSAGGSTAISNAVSASASAASTSKKKARPPPLMVNDAAAIPLPPPPHTFQPLPTMRGVYNQQIIVTPSAQVWDVQEQAQLERLHRVMCFPHDSLLNKSIKIAAHLGRKTVRDVACRLKLMEEHDAAEAARPQDEIDRLLKRAETMVSEMQAISVPVPNRTEEQSDKLKSLIKDFVASSKDIHTKLEQKQPKLPLQYISLPEVPDFAKS